MGPNSSNASTSTDAPRRLLVRGVNWLGDAVMTAPALQRLRERHPGAHIALLTPAKLAGLWQGHTALDQVLPFNREEGLWRISRRLEAGHFDTALVLPNSPRSALEVWLARIPHRVGCARSWRNWFLSEIVTPRRQEILMRKRSVDEIRALIESDQSVAAEEGPTAPAAGVNAHQSLEYLHLAAALGADPAPVPPALFISDDEVVSVARRFGLPEENSLLAGLNPGAEYGPAKRWPAERFAAAAIELSRRTGCRWLVFGGPNDHEVTQQTASAIEADAGGSSALNLAGQTSLRELMALLKSCHLLLTNDTGPMHVAAALGTPVIVPFGSTSPELTGPAPAIGSRHQLLKATVPCSPCFLRVCPIDFRCMHQITVQDVVDAGCRVLT